MNTAQQDTLLSLTDISVRFSTEDGPVEAVRGVSFSIRRGETVALVGESGSGKSVTARTVMGLLPPKATLGEASRVLFDGSDIGRLSDKALRQYRGNRIAMIFQEPMTSLNPVYTIADQIIEMIQAHRRLSKTAARARALELLREVAIPEPERRLDSYPHQLSGGQRQRVMIAMALANEPELLIADEPTTALDVTVQAQILHLLDDLKRRHNMSVLLITHDLTIVRKFAQHVHVMEKGRLVESNDTETLFGAPQHPYTRRLLASEPDGSADPLDGASPELLSAADIRVHYQVGRKKVFSRQPAPVFTAVRGIDLSLKKGEALGIVGESGSGKTTLGHAILGLLEAEGQVMFDGDCLSGLSRASMRPYRSRIQIVFQDPFASLNPRMTVRQIIQEGMLVNGIGRDREDRERRAARALSDAGLGEFALNRFPHEFSGGQRQRIAIARAIAMEPELILLDEPTSALDLTVQKQIIELLKKLQRQYGLSYLLISHDLRVVRSLCQRIIVMNSGEVVEQGGAGDILDRPAEAYTQQLVRAAFAVEA